MKNELLSGALESIHMEIAIHSTLSHPHILPFVTAFEDDSFIYVVTR